MENWISSYILSIIFKIIGFNYINNSYMIKAVLDISIGWVIRIHNIILSNETHVVLCHILKAPSNVPILCPFVKVYVFFLRWR